MDKVPTVPKVLRIAFGIMKRSILGLMYLIQGMRHLRAQCEISGTYKFLQDIFKMMGLEIPHIQIELPFKRPKDLALMAAYQDYYGQDVKFDCDQAAFILDDIQILQIKVPSADTLTYRVYEEKCLQDLAKLEKNENLKLTVVEYVEDYLELQNGVIPTMTETACAFNHAFKRWFGQSPRQYHRNS